MQASAWTLSKTIKIHQRSNHPICPRFNKEGSPWSLSSTISQPIPLVSNVRAQSSASRTDRTTRCLEALPNVPLRVDWEVSIKAVKGSASLSSPHHRYRKAHSAKDTAWSSASQPWTISKTKKRISQMIRMLGFWAPTVKVASAIHLKRIISINSWGQREEAKQLMRRAASILQKGSTQASRRSHQWSATIWTSSQMARWSAAIRRTTTTCLKVSRPPIRSSRWPISLPKSRMTIKHYKTIKTWPRVPMMISDSLRIPRRSSWLGCTVEASSTQTSR